MRLCVVRGPFLNAADIGNYMGAVNYGIDLTFASTGLNLVEFKSVFQTANFFDYGIDLTSVVEKDFDVIDVPDMFYPFSMALAKRHERVIHVAWDNNPGRNSGNHALSLAWRHVARSTMARQTLEYDGVHPNAIRIIFGSVDTEFFHPKPYKDRLDAVLFASRLVPEKGLEHAYWAMWGLPAELWVTHDSLSGTMPGVEAARAGAKAIGRQNRIGMRNVLQSVKALVFPSMPLVSNHPHGRWTEQFGQLLIEAMACGTPVIAYDSGAIPEVLGSELTQYCTCGDWAALSAMLKHVLTNKALWNRLSEYNRARAVKVFDQHVIGGQIASWYSVD